MARLILGHAFRLTLAVAGLAALLATFAATPAGAAGEGNGVTVERPFREMPRNDVIVGGCSGFPVVVCDFTVDGQLVGTHIGLADDLGSGTATLDFSTPCVDGAGRPGNLGTSEFSGVITAADGSELFYEGVTTNCFVSTDVTDPNRTGRWTITGGTGRFEGATGTVIIDGSGVNAGTITF